MSEIAHLLAFIAVYFLVSVGIWNLVGRPVLRPLSDRFRLDVSRVVEIDGHEFVIRGWTASESYTDAHEITVTFEKYTDAVEGRKNG